MARSLVTITLDTDKAAQAQALLGAVSTSEVIDRALDRLLYLERLRQDIAAYKKHPPTDEELAMALAGDVSGLDDDTDWEALCKDWDGRTST